VDPDDFEERRALNMLWNAARDYTIEPRFLAFENGEAEPYLNCVAGAVYRHYDWEKIEVLFRQIARSRDRHRLENFLWLALEHCAYGRESVDRPALEGLRLDYARRETKRSRARADQRQFDRVYDAHFCRVLSLPTRLSGEDLRLLDDIELSPALDTGALVARVTEIFGRYFGFRPTRPELLASRYRAPAISFGRGKIVCIDKKVISDPPPCKRSGGLNFGRDVDAGIAYADVVREFGRPAFTEADRLALERAACAGAHAACRLHVTAGYYGQTRGDSRAGNDGQIRVERQRKLNEEFYAKNRARNEAEIRRLADRIKNALSLAKSRSWHPARRGALDSRRAWRAAVLGSRRVFRAASFDETPDVSVDVLLDGSSSLARRQETIAAQGFMIAEALSRCGLPIRVTSFCSVGSFTVLRIFREYDEREKNAEVFRYAAIGWNRDGLALRAMRALMRSSPAERRLLIILTDANPNDERNLAGSGAWGRGARYEGDAGVDDAVIAARGLRADGIALSCVFCGPDNFLSAAREIYGARVARVPSMDRLADAVGKIVSSSIASIR